MIHVILHEPEIPPNTGNVMRLCANTGARLHLVHPLGFSLDERSLRRAGLDYREWADVEEHTSLPACLARLAITVDRAAAGSAVPPPGPSLYAFSTRNTRLFTEAAYREGDALLFGAETRGLPDACLEALPAAWRLRLPMRPDSRSLNLSNAVAVAVFEAWRQLGFRGGR